ncbi:unnamed protein product [Bursaphelenchus okinawaensis]|uniref:Uncharacterized protein n=1 Tax=Bursaphelenchus okinawaensis TaxID=465554 RepID=A0A811KFD3_9BILA|nr:unnamed protein product [Bursaphelenchus okinawaensis]CAG9103512.1 unnamed protein product [Bursaphelenchus okinawaensis]
MTFGTANLFNDRTTPETSSIFRPGVVLLPKVPSPDLTDEDKIRSSYFEAMKTLADQEGIKLSQNPSILDIKEGLRDEPRVFPAKIYRPRHVARYQSSPKLCQKLRMC